jgi:hypothetical protein
VRTRIATLPSCLHTPRAFSWPTHNTRAVHGNVRGNHNGKFDASFSRLIMSCTN